MYRERLRVNGLLTNCETGDRLITVKKLESPLPTLMQIGKYRAVVKHKGQINENITCNNCLAKGHVSKDCKSDKFCRECRKAGHIKSECLELWVNSDQATGESMPMDKSTGISDGLDVSKPSQGVFLLHPHHHRVRSSQYVKGYACVVSKPDDTHVDNQTNNSNVQENAAEGKEKKVKKDRKQKTKKK